MALFSTPESKDHFQFRFIFKSGIEIELVDALEKLRESGFYCPKVPIGSNVLFISGPQERLLEAIRLVKIPVELGKVDNVTIMDSSYWKWSPQGGFLIPTGVGYSNFDNILT